MFRFSFLCDGRAGRLLNGELNSKCTAEDKTIFNGILKNGRVWVVSIARTSHAHACILHAHWMISFAGLPHCDWTIQPSKSCYTLSLQPTTCRTGPIKLGAAKHSADIIRAHAMRDVEDGGSWKVR